MALNLNETIIRAEDKYAIGVPTDRPSPISIMESYHNLEQLEAGYEEWKKRALEKKVPFPIPLERVNENYWKVFKKMLPKGS